MIDKSTRQHYAIQGGGPNYLGKQKMVTAPKKWKSSPDHETAELAYITKKEKDILLDLNIYGSLKNGKPNRGPSGIISLQGDMGGWSGGGGGGSSGGGGGPHGGGGGGGGGGGQAAQRAAQQAAAQRAMQAQVAAAEKQQAAQAAAQRAEADRQQRVAQQAAAEKAAVQKAKTAAETQSKMSGRGPSTKPPSKGLGETLKSGFPIAETLMNVAAPAINFGRGVLGYQDPVATPSMQDRMIELESKKGPTGSIGYEDYGLPVSTPGGRFTGGLFDLALNDPVDFGLAGSAGRYGFSPEGRTGLKYDFTPDPDTGSAGSAILDFINKGGVKGKLANLNLMGTAQAATPGYQNIFDTGAVSQTSGRAPVTTGEGDKKQEIIDLYKEGKIDNLQLAIEDADRHAKGEKTNYEKTTGIKPGSSSYQNIFQTGAIQQTPGRAPVTTGEGLGSIAGPIQGLINQPKIAGPIQGLINQQKPVINPFEQTGNLPGGAYKPPAQIKNPFEQPGARTDIPKPPLRTRIQDERAEDIRKRALGNIALQTDKSLMDVSDPSGQGQGIMSSFADTGKSMIGNQLKKGATSFALNKLGLGFLNPFLGIASLFGKDPIGALMAKLPKGTGTKTAWAGPSEADLRGGNQGQAPANVIQAGIEKFQPTDQQTAQMDEMRRKMMILQGHADKGQLNEQGMSTLAQMNQLISQYQADPRSIYG